MTESLRISVELSERRSALNELIEKRNALPDGQSPSDDDVRSMDEATRAIRDLEVRYRAAVTKEGAESQETEDAGDPEQREVRRLLGEASLMPYVHEALGGRPVDGVERELREAMFPEQEATVPLELLLPPDQRSVEVRQDAATTLAAGVGSDGAESSVPARVFTRSLAARLGVAMPSVPVGQAHYPILTGGTTAKSAADAAQVNAAAATFTQQNLDPVRLTAGYLFNVRQSLQLASFESILRRDLTAVINDQLDNYLINGSDEANATVEGLLEALTAPADPSAVSTWDQVAGAFIDAVDGLNAYMISDLRSVWSAAAYKYAAKLYPPVANVTHAQQSAWDWVGERAGERSVSSRIADGTKTSTIVQALTSYPGRNAVAPMWQGMQIIRDPYTGASKGQVRLTAILFFNMKVLRTAGWKLFKVRHSA